MTYDIFVWDPKKSGHLPHSEEDALRVVEELKAIREPHNPKFVAFATLLAQCYEHRAAEINMVGGISAFWGSDPRLAMAETRYAAHRISLPGDGCIRQIAYAVKSAALLGLIVYDDENGMCFLPNGDILPTDMREVWELDLEDMNAAPSDPARQKSDGRNFWERLGSTLLDELSRGNKRG